MNYTKREKRLLYLFASLPVVLWIGVIAGICNLVYVAIAATVYCIVGMEVWVRGLGFKGSIRRRIVYGGIAFIVFILPVICLIF